MPEFQEPDGECNPPARVYLDGQRVPIIEDGARVEWRKEGPLSQQFVADVYVPLEDSYGQDWTDVYMNAQYGICDIEIRNWETERYTPIPSGVVIGVGSGESGPLEARLRVVDPALLLKEIPVQRKDQFTKQTSLSTVLSRLATSFKNGNPTFDTVQLGKPEILEVEAEETEEVTEQDPAGDTTTGSIYDAINITDEIYQGIVEPGLEYLTDNEYPSEFGGDEETETASGVTLNKNFEAYTDSLADVAAYVEGIQNIRLSFMQSGGGRGDTETLLAAMPPQTQPTYQTENNGGRLRWIENNMLAEINPINTLEVVGGRTVEESDDESTDGTSVVELYTNFEGAVAGAVPSAQEVKTTAKVRHEPTYEIAGQAITTTVEKAEIRQVGELVNVAKSELKDRMDTAGHGNATFTLSPYLSPYNIIQMPFQCGSDTIFQYEIERITHHAGPTQRGENGPPRTEVQCSFATRDEDITVIESGTKAI